METERVHEGDLADGWGDDPAAIADRYADDLAALHEVSTLPPGDPEERLGQWLDAGLAALGATQGLVLLGLGEELVVRAATVTDVGGAVPGDEIVDRRIAEAIERRATVASLGGSRADDEIIELGRGSLVASPLWVTGTVGGAVAFVAPPDHPPFTAWALALVDLVADGVSRVLEHQADVRELVAVRSHAEAMIDLIPDPIVRLDRRGYRLGESTIGPFDPCEAVRAPDDAADDETYEQLRHCIAAVLEDRALRTIVFATDDSPKARRVETRVVPAADDEVLCIVRDITERHRAEQALAEQVAFEALVTSISTRLISCSPSALDEAIVIGLGEIASFFAADAAFIHELSADGVGLHVSHLWARPGFRDGRRRGQRVDVAGFGWLSARFEDVGHVYARGPVDATREPALAALSDPDDLGVLWVRLGYGEDLAGLVGLTWRTREPPAGDEVLGSVRFAADAFHGAIRRRSVTLLAQGQAEVFESIARREPVDTSLLAARDLLARHTLGATVLVLTVDDDRLGLVTDVPDDPLTPWFADLALDLENPYGQAVVTGEPVAVADARSDPRFGDRTVPDPAHHSMAAHPVRSSRDGRTLAVIALLGERASATVPRPDVLASAASLVAVALEREADLRRLAHQATHDPLTGVGNRAALLDRLQVVLARARRSGRAVAVLFCDLDGFKAVNDEHGHDRGDRLLVEVAERIRHAVRPSDTVSRTGGDEFVVVCEDLTDAEQADVIAQRVRDAVEDTPVALGELRLPIAISVGLALADPMLDDPDRLLRTADLAMYESKQRNRRAGSAARRVATGAIELPGPRGPASTLEAALAQAVALGDFELHHQPLVGRDGSIAGIEALLRWPNGDASLGAPRLVATIGELGLAASLGRWVRRRAIADRTAWRPGDDGPAFPPVHVNVAGAELLSTGFVEGLRADLDDAGVELNDLVVEVSEADLLDPRARAVLHDLADASVPVLVDGVGQGGLALADLAALPVRGLKLGPDLVSGLVADARSSAVEVVRSLVLLAHGLGWKSLAVGVETEHQRAVLLGFGIDAVQGRAVTMPVDVEQLLAWLGARGDA